MMTDTKGIIDREISASDAAIDGLLSGVQAGLVMATYLVLTGWLGGGDPLARLSLFAPDPKSGPLVGLLAHLAVSAIYGVLFGVGYAGLLRRPTYNPSPWLHALIGALYGLLLLLAAWTLILPATGSQLQQIPFVHLVIGHLLYGALLGWLLYRSPRRVEG
jgi:hypothetical protein